MNRKFKEFNKFYINVFSVFCVQILIKIVGMIYNLYLTNNETYSDAGNGIFMSAHQIYILFLTISIVGIPTSISKLISSRSRNNEDVHKIVNISLMIWGFIGVLESIFLINFSEFISNKILGNIYAEDVLKILAVGITFVNFNAVLRGALNGIEKTSEGVIIQFIEQLIKVIFTIVGIYWLSYNRLENQMNILYIVSYGVTLSVIITFFIYMYKWKKYKNNIIEDTNIRYIEIIKNVFLLSIPITIIGMFGSINKNIDSISLRLLLKDIFDINRINEMYGIIISKVDVLINLPIGLNSSLTLTLLPKLSRLYSERKINEMKNVIISSINVSMCLAIPIMIGYMFFSKEIFDLLYPNANSGFELLRLSSALIVLNIILQIIMVYFNSIGNTNIIIKTFIIGAISKLLLNILLIRLPIFYEKGIIISSIISDLFIILILVRRKEFQKLNFKIVDLKINEIIFDTTFMIFIILFIDNVGGFFKVNNKILFIISLRNRGIFIFL